MQILKNCFIDGTTFQTGKSFSGLAAGTYTLTAKDSKGCLGTASVTITQNAINVTSYAWNASSCAATNGKIQLFLTGGFSPYSYSIDGVTYQTSNLFTNLSAGTYTGYVKDAAGCLGMKTGIAVGPSGCNAPFAGSNNTKQIQVTGNNAELKVQVFPNPGETEFTLVLPGYDSRSKVSIIVTDILGKKVYQAEGIGKQQYRFGKGFVAGVYHLEVIKGTGENEP